MEQVFVVVLGVLNHFRCIVFQIAIRAALTRLVGLILLRPHCHHILDSPFNNCVLNSIDAQDELEQFAKLLLWVRQDVFGAEKVDRLGRVLGHIEPVIKPLSVPMGAIFLEAFPIRKDGLLSKILFERLRVTLGKDQVEEGRVGVELVPCADHSDVGIPVPLERKDVGEVSLVDPCALVSYAFGLEAAVLECNVRRVLDHLVRASGSPSYILEILAHQAIPATRIRRVHDGCLLLTVTSSVSCLRAEE